jgi:AcrR family transcriptional regulator
MHSKINKQTDCMQVESKRRSNPQRTAAMRSRLIETARRLFVDQGFGATSTPAIVDVAGVTRGALYHHFPDKTALFRAVIEAEAASVSQAIEVADAAEGTGLQRLVAGARAYLHAMQGDGRVRLLLIDGPAILGRQDLREIEATRGDAALKLGIAEAMADKSLPDLPIDALSSLLSAVFERAAMDLSEGVPEAEVLATVEAILHGLSRSAGA